MVPLFKSIYSFSIESLFYPSPSPPVVYLYLHCPEQISTMLYRGYLPDFLVTIRMYFILSICPYIVPSWNRKHQKVLSYLAYVFSLCASEYNLHDDVDTSSFQRMLDFLCCPIIKMLVSSDMLIPISRKGQNFPMYFEVLSYWL
jgi:hypothetical protein